MDTIRIVKFPDSSAILTLVHEKGGASNSYKIGYFLETTGEILVTNPGGFFDFVDDIGTDKFMEIQQAFSGTVYKDVSRLKKN